MKYAPFFGCMITVKYPQMEATVRRTAENLGDGICSLWMLSQTGLRHPQRKDYRES